MSARFLSGFGVSSLALAAVMFVWPQLFLFSKVVHYPSWALALPLPLPFGPATLLASVCLVPAAFVPSTLRLALVAALGASIAASVMLVLASLSEWSTGHVLANAAFNFAWSLLPCSGAGILVVALRFAARKLSREAHG